MWNMKGNAKVGVGGWVINLLVFGAMLAASVFNDANGRLPGLTETASHLTFGSIWLFGAVADGYVGLFDKNGGRRAVAIGIAILYLMVLVPVIS
ncbi:MAG: hypothetical protein NTV86_08215 [Planctomycetota bacterium]|nr:hypothetical protein [Planctomycetota bacterium]